MTGPPDPTRVPDRPDTPAPGDTTARPPSNAASRGGPPRLPAGFEATGAPLGAGATAVVWPARRVVDGREFALKVWRRPLADPDERERFRREVRQHAALNRVSGHVVSYTWAEEDPPDGPAWISTERHGVSLDHVLEQGRPPLPQGLALCADLLAGLAAMHAHGALHRDVKPGNVVAEDGRAKLCDLGLVMDFAAFTRDNAAGTPRYVAPELLEGSAAPSPRTDVYSAAQTIRQILGPVPQPLEQLLTEATSVNPADRPADAAQFEARFRAAAVTLGHDLPPPLPARAGAGEPLRRSKQEGAGRRSRRRALVPVVAAVAVLAGGAAVVGVDRLSAERGGAESATDATAGAGGGQREPQLPDAARAEPDITSDGRPIVLPPAEPGRCNVVLPTAQSTGERPYYVDATLVAVLQTWYSTSERQACAKLVKPPGSPYAGTKTHLALTLCGDANSCDRDWNAYATDAGPAVVPSQDGCVSTRVSMLDDTGSRWLVRDDVQSLGCS